MNTAEFETVDDGEGQRIVMRGNWTIEGGLVEIDDRLRRLKPGKGRHFSGVDVEGVAAFDTTGALMVQRMRHRCLEGQQQAEMPLIGVDSRHRELLSQIEQHLDDCRIEPPRRDPFLMVLNRIGMGTTTAAEEFVAIVNLIGATSSRIFRAILNPRHFRPTSMVHHMEESGLNATLIVGLMSFLIGAVVAFMGARVLAEFGAQLFTVELVGIAVLREFGVLLTAILIAGRSGSAFTAQIGSMQLREEIDAMRVMGIDPLDALVVPRVVALVLFMPVLAFLASFLGVLGGGLVGWLALDISPSLFMSRFQETVTLANLMVGVIKAPFFAFAIGVIGCYHGLSVESSAEDLGRRTTMAVVQSLFTVILLDAMFAMLFLELDV